MTKESSMALAQEIDADGRARTYNTWGAMKQRCLNPNSGAYRDYGGRGIKICSRWMIFENFLADMGARPEGVGTNLLTADEARQMFEHALAASEKEK